MTVARRSIRCGTRRTGGCRGSRSRALWSSSASPATWPARSCIPAVYDLANRGLLPPGFVVLGFARRDWGDGDFESLAREAAPGRTPAPRGGRRCGRGWPATSSSSRGSFDDDAAFDHARRDAGRAARHARHPRQRGVLPLDPAVGVPDRAQAARAHRHGRQRASPAAGAGSWWRSRSATTCSSARELNDLVDDVFTAAGRVPHRPLPRQGDGAEHPGAALRQRAVRAGVELQVRRLGADHDGRGRRHRHPGRRSTTRPAPPATCCRTTCCSCSR